MNPHLSRYPSWGEPSSRPLLAAPPPRNPGARSNVVLRGAGVAGVLGIALIHLLDLARALGEIAYLPVLYVLLIAGCVVAAWLLLRSDPAHGWRLAGGLAGATSLPS